MQSIFQTHLNCHTCSQHYTLQCTVHNYMLLITNLRIRRTRNQHESGQLPCTAMSAYTNHFACETQDYYFTSNTWTITDNRGHNLFCSLLHIYILPSFLPYSFPILHPPFHFLFGHFLNFQFNAVLNEHIFWFRFA